MARERKLPPNFKKLAASSTASARSADFTRALPAPEPEPPAPAPVPEEITDENNAADEAGAVHDPGPAPVLEAVPDPQAPEPDPEPEKRRKPRRPKLTPEAARKLVGESSKSAVLHKADWVRAGVRLTVENRRRLNAWVAGEVVATGNTRLALAHVVNAALSLVPADPVKAGNVGLAHLEATAGQRLETVGSATRLHRDVELAMRTLPAQMRSQFQHGLLVHVQNAYVQMLLDALQDDSKDGE